MPSPSVIAASAVPGSLPPARERPPLASIPAGLSTRPELRGAWTSVSSQSFGSRVYRVDGASPCFVKTMPHPDASDLRFSPQAEARRLGWLAEQGIAVPEVIELGADESAAWLITRAVPGRVAASEWRPHEHARILESVADLARSLHRLPVESCPFDGRSTHTLAWAEVATRSGWVDTEDLDEAHRGWSAEALLAELRATAVPPEDLVVCHGDLCLDNLIIDPERLCVAAVIDVGRLGVADRWRDLSLLVRSLTEDEAWAAVGDPVAALLGRYGTPLDATKARFYQLLDEFF
jgi:aminoglycoside phosphotransferase